MPCPPFNGALWLGVANVLTVWMSSSARGQALPPVFDPTGRSGEPPPPLRKEFQPPPTPPPSPVLPSAPLPPEEVEKRFADIRVFVHDIHVVGSTVFSEEELAKVTAPFRGRTITSQDLERLRLALTLFYVDNGYINSGAVIPDQDVTFGVITVQIIEGEADPHRDRRERVGSRWLSTGPDRARHQDPRGPATVAKAAAALTTGAKQDSNL